MFTSLLLGAALTAPAAPIPRDAIAAPTGPAPQIAYLKADANGQVWVLAISYQKQTVTRATAVIDNGKQVVKQEQVEITVPTQTRKQLGDLGAKFTTAEGTEITTADALKRVKDGSAVVVSADGKPIEKAWLRSLNPDAVIITAEGLVGATIQNNGPQFATTPAPRLVLLAADMDGKLRIAINPNATNTDGAVTIGRGRVIVNGNVAAIQPAIAIDSVAPVAPGAAPTGEAAPTKPLADVKFDAYDLTGKAVPKEEALKRLTAGGLVLIAGDNRIPDAAFLKLFRNDLLVLVSPELVGVANPAGVPAIGLKPGIVRPLPAPIAPGGAIAVPVKPAVIRPAVQLPAKPIEEKAPEQPGKTVEKPNPNEK